MSNVPMIASVTDVPLQSAPIEASWIREGKPVARNMPLSRSADRTATTLVWDCTAGKFEWHYDIDETIYFLEGEAIISDRVSPPKTFRAGDVLFIPKGAVCDWHVEKYVKKVAFCRTTLPASFGLMVRILGRVKRMVRGSSAPSGFAPAA